MVHLWQYTQEREMVQLWQYQMCCLQIRIGVMHVRSAQNKPTPGLGKTRYHQRGSSPKNQTQDCDIMQHNIEYSNREQQIWHYVNILGST